VPLVSKPASFACRAERLAWAGAGPDRLVVTDACGSERAAPDSDAGEEMDLGVSREVVGCEVENRSPVNSAGRDLPGANEVFEPVGGEVVDLVVEGESIHRTTHAPSPTMCSCPRSVMIVRTRRCL
jgi:hypothetical protein